MVFELLTATGKIFVKWDYCDASDLRGHWAHHDFTVMKYYITQPITSVTSFVSLKSDLCFDDYPSNQFAAGICLGCTWMCLIEKRELQMSKTITNWILRGFLERLYLQIGLWWKFSQR